MEDVRVVRPNVDPSDVLRIHSIALLGLPNSDDRLRVTDDSFPLGLELVKDMARVAVPMLPVAEDGSSSLFVTSVPASIQERLMTHVDTTDGRADFSESREDELDRQLHPLLPSCWFGKGCRRRMRRSPVVRPRMNTRARSE